MPIDKRTIPEKVQEEVDKVILKIITFSEKARKEGLLSLFAMLDKEALKDRNNLFEYGMCFVCDGWDAADIREMLGNVLLHKEQTYSQKITDSLCVAGALGIQRGDNTSKLILLLDSLVPEQSRSEWLKGKVLEVCFRMVGGRE